MPLLSVPPNNLKSQRTHNPQKLFLGFVLNTQEVLVLFQPINWKKIVEWGFKFSLKQTNANAT